MSNALFGPKSVYLGIFANDAAANAYVVTQGWDLAGVPRDGMFYFDSTLGVFKGWYSGIPAWVAMGASTPEGGIVTTMVNDTGAVSVKGNIVEPSGAVNSGFVLAVVDALDPIGIVYEGGIANGQSCLVVVAGLADVLLENGTAATRANWLRTSSNVPGRGDASNPIPVPPTSAVHFEEVGHVLQTVGPGTDVLARCAIHFN
jgi:hypothetical protein